MTSQVSNSKVSTLKVSTLSLLCAGLIFLSLIFLSPLHAQAPLAVSAEAARVIRQTEADRKADRFIEALARLPPPTGASSADQKALLRETADIQEAWARSFGDRNPVQTLTHFHAALAINRTLRPDRTGDDFNEIGMALLALRRYDEAISSFQQARTIHHQAGNQAGEAVALVNSGTTCEEAGRPGEAITTYRQAVAIYQCRGDKDSAGMIFSDLGDTYNGIGQYRSAAACYQHSLTLSQQASDRGAVAGALSNLGNDYSALHQYEKALDCYQRLLPSYTQFGSGDARAGTLDRLGNTCRALGQYPQAASFYHRALAVYQQERERDKEAEVLADMKLNGEAAAAKISRETHWTSCISAWNETPGHLKYDCPPSRTWDNPRVHFSCPHRWTAALLRTPTSVWGMKAIDLCKKSTERMEDREEKIMNWRYYCLLISGNLVLLSVSVLPDRSLRAQAAPALPPPKSSAANLITRARADVDSGRFADALALLHTPPSDASPANHRVLQLATADVQFDWGHSLLLSSPTQALAHSSAAFVIDKGERPADAARDLNDMGLASDAISQYSNALSFYRQALALDRRFNNRIGQGYALMNIGTVYNDLSQTQKAIIFFQQALAIYQQVGDGSNRADILMSLGSSYLILDQYGKALGFYQKALPIYRQAGDMDSQATILMNTGSAYDGLGQHTKAINFFQQAQPLYQRVGDKNGQANILLNIGLAHVGLRQYQIAISFYQQALPTYRQIGDKSDEAKALNNLGVANNVLGQPAKAVPLFQQAIAIYQQIGDKPNAINSQRNLDLANQHLQSQ